ncbi:MAG: CCA tRNA nucleotidyltransferase [Candidatus Bathyarchaeota archaeon]|nr:CCA tRNA nucleotidyltransferase [Candidatus Bathyarchaeota archaeon]
MRNREAMNWSKLREEVLGEIKPTPEDEKNLLCFAQETVEDINKVLAEAGLDAAAELHGSVAHGTWIKGQQDLDIFIVNEEYRSRDQLQQVLEVLKMGTEWIYSEAYAEHPYLKTQINGYSLDFVPCFRVDEGELYSSTDRTPLHTRWLSTRLDSLGDDVRLLKRFLMTLGIYGAEIKIGGFSGYLCELLIIYYRGFCNLMEAVAQWNNKEVLSFTGEQREFDDPLTFIDPVDPSRNVASALREENYSLFIAAASSFVKNQTELFFKREENNVTPEMVLNMLGDRPTSILFLVIEEGNADIADVLWGQIHKSRQAVKQQLENNGFKVLRCGAWSNEETRHIFIYELESAEIPEAVKHMGPPANLENNVRQFIDAYKDNPRTIAGPDLLKSRWYVLVKREYTDVKKLMESLLTDGGRNIGVSKKLSVRILQHHRVLLDTEVGDYLKEGFEAYLYDWLKGRPQWIE